MKDHLKFSFEGKIIYVPMPFKYLEIHKDFYDIILKILIILKGRNRQAEKNFVDLFKNKGIRDTYLF